MVASALLYCSHARLPKTSLSVCSKPGPPAASPAAVAQPLCGYFPDSGPCTAAMPAWFFSPVSLQCQLFVYGGCLGNANRFTSLEACAAACAVPASIVQPLCLHSIAPCPLLQHPLLHQTVLYYRKPMS